MYTLSMLSLTYLFLFTLGAVFGSFISALSYRIANGISISDGRSICPNCKKTISAKDNIPIVSYLMLGGKCRNCNRHISIRYPLIEIATAIIFVSIYILLVNCSAISVSGIACELQQTFRSFTLPYLLFIGVLLITLFIIDFEYQIIPDEITYLLLTATVLLFIGFDVSSIFTRLAVGFITALFLLLLHLVTKGKGMGLGDVKFALFGGFLVGWPLVLVWMFLSFLIGSIIGIFLIAIGKAEFGRHIAFGPFLIIALFITVFWGDIIKDIIFIGLNL